MTTHLINRRLQKTLMLGVSFLVTLSFVTAASFASAASAAAETPAKAKKPNSLRLKAAKTTKVSRTPSVADFTKDGNPNLLSHAVMVFDQNSGKPLFAKNADTAVPIASITKLMTSIVVLDAKLNLDEPVVISEADIDVIKNSRSRLPVGTAFRREDLMRLALMASDNRAAAALGRSYPGGTIAFVAAMNTKAKDIGLTNTRFADATGLSPSNVASPQDLALMVAEASKHKLIREFSTAPELYVTLPDSGKQLGFNNTNSLVKSDNWNIGVSKTGFINEAGKCLVMQAMIGNNPVIIVLMDSWGKLTRIGDANRIKKWIESGKVAIVPTKFPAKSA